MNERDSKTIHDLFSEFHNLDNLGLLKSKLSDYVTTIREEARRTAFKEAITITQNAHSQYKNQSSLREAIITALETAIALEAAEKGERDG